MASVKRLRVHESKDDEDEPKWFYPFFKVVSVPADDPNSQAWHDERSGSCGGSDIGSYVGFTNNFSDGSRTSVLKREREHIEKVFSDDELHRMQHGHRKEDAARRFFSRNMNIGVSGPRMLRPTNHNPNFDFGEEKTFHVTTDGEIVGCAVVEIKSPYSTSSYLYLRKRISENYLAQVHLQMAVTGYNVAYLVVCLFSDDHENDENDNGDIPQKAVIYKVNWSGNFWDWMYPKAKDMIHMIKHDDMPIPDDFDWPENWKMYPSVDYKIVYEKK